MTDKIEENNLHFHQNMNQNIKARGGTLIPGILSSLLLLLLSISL